MSPNILWKEGILSLVENHWQNFGSWALYGIYFDSSGFSSF